MEQNLWVRFQKGDRKAFGSIYSLYIDELFAYGTRLCSNVPLVKDGIQDVFIDLYENRRTLSEPRNTKFYLFKVLKRTLFKKLEKEKKNISFTEIGFTELTSDYSFERSVIDRETYVNKIRLIKELMGQLTSKQQEILYLRFTMGFNYIEISEIVRIDHNSVRKQVYRAIRHIRESTTFKNHVGIILFYSWFKSR